MSRPANIIRELRPTLVLALPIVGGHVGQILLGLTDSVMIGRAGAVPLAASAFAGAVFGVVYVAAIGLLTSVAVRTAFAFGAGQQRQAGEVLRHGLLIALASSVVLAAGLHVLAGFLEFFRQPAEVAREARPYLAIIGWSLVPGLMFLALKQFYEALNRPWVPMAWVLIGVAGNIFLNWVLIYGKLGAPALGLTGAGWATLLARVIVLAGLLVHLLRSPALEPIRPVSWTARPHRREIRELFALGWPAAVQLLFEAGLFSAAGILMGWLGVAALAAHQIALSCAATTFMFPLGISQALTVRVGHARGARRIDLVRAIGFGGVGAGAAIMAGFAVVFLVAGRLLASVFVEDEPVVRLAAQLLVVAGIFQIFDGTQVTSIGALRGLADVRGPTVITFAGYWVLALPAAAVLGFVWGFGPVGVWSGLAVGLAVCATLLLGRFAALTGRPHGGR
jgi:multidrug resistance protein, MATE family